MPIDKPFKKRLFVCCLQFILYLFSFFIIIPSWAVDTGFLNRVVSSQKTDYKYQVYVPQQWNNKKKWPVILFLHGAGERGSDGLLQTDIGIAKSIRQNKDLVPAIVVMPQCHKNRWWSDLDMEQQALDALKQSIQEFNGDPKRIYLTGLSMGGYGSWNIGAKFPHKFAAIISLAGRLRPADGIYAAPGSIAASGIENIYQATAEKIQHIPIRVFHGAEDKVVPVTESRRVVAELTKLNADVKYTEYQGMPHNIWDITYSRPELYNWLFKQSR